MNGRKPVTRRQFLRWAAAGSAAAAASCRAPAKSPKPTPDGPNVLFITVDDLRPELGCYGNGLISSPNIDGLAAGGVRFERAYCQQALCNPSRVSVMTGVRPDTSRIYELKTHFRTTIPDAVTLPQYFMNQGYHSQGVGKIYHAWLHDDPSWSAPWWGPNLEDQNLEKTALNLQKGEWGPACLSLDVPDEAFPDGQTAQAACDALGQLRDTPFFLAVGFRKPHLAYMAPRRYFDLYPPDKIEAAPNPFPPEGAPSVAVQNFWELRHYAPVPDKGPVPEHVARQLIRGYYAGISYTDAQVGRLLRKLEELGLDDRTVVVLWGDNGYLLGEHGLWCKHCNFEEAVRVPLIVRAPGQAVAGAKTGALTECVDMYPSLCQLTGLPRRPESEGTSFVPLLTAPDRPWKKAAFSQYLHQFPDVGRIMGYTMRTDRYRFTEWRGLDKKFLVRELYDHEVDPGENVNLAVRPESRELVAQLGSQLNAGWKAALPPQA